MLVLSKVVELAEQAFVLLFILFLLEEVRVCVVVTQFCTQMSIAEAFGVERLPTMWRVLLLPLFFVGCIFCNETGGVAFLVSSQ